MKHFITTKKLILLSLLVAIDVLLTRVLAINTPVVKIGLGFASTAVAAILYGPLWAAAEAGTADLLGAVILPTGAYNPCFTITAIITGAIFGLFLRGDAPGWRRCLGAAAVNCVLVELIANSLLIHWFYGTPLAWPFIGLRLLKFAVMLPAEFLVLTLLTRNDSLRRAVRGVER